MIAIFQNEFGEITAKFKNAELLKDNGLETLVLISLFTDKRDNNSRGWWGSVILGANLGSRIWRIFEDGKLSTNNLNRLKKYSLEALEWMKKEGLVKTINIIVTRLGQKVFLDIKLDEQNNYKYNLNWREQKVNPLHKKI